MIRPLIMLSLVFIPISGFFAAVLSSALNFWYSFLEYSPLLFLLVKKSRISFN